MASATIIDDALAIVNGTSERETDVITIGRASVLGAANIGSLPSLYCH